MHNAQTKVGSLWLAREAEAHHIDVVAPEDELIIVIIQRRHCILGVQLCHLKDTPVGTRADFDLWNTHVEADKDGVRLVFVAHSEGPKEEVGVGVALNEEPRLRLESVFRGVAKLKEELRVPVEV